MMPVSHTLFPVFMLLIHLFTPANHWPHIQAMKGVANKLRKARCRHLTFGCCVQCYNWISFSLSTGKLPDILETRVWLTNTVTWTCSASFFIYIIYKHIYAFFFFFLEHCLLQSGFTGSSDPWNSLFMFLQVHSLKCNGIWCCSSVGTLLSHKGLGYRHFQLDWLSLEKSLESTFKIHSFEFYSYKIHFRA